MFATLYFRELHIFFEQGQWGVKDSPSLFKFIHVFDPLTRYICILSDLRRDISKLKIKPSIFRKVRLKSVKSSNIPAGHREGGTRSW